MPSAPARPTAITEVQEVVRSLSPGARILPRGGGTKTALSSPPDGETLIDVAGLSGMVEYEPGEFTFTALAGTRVAEVAATLAGHGQYLPFDPPLVAAGATLGGTVAAGLSGPGRYRYGGVRDFILGERHVDGSGQVIHSGGKVVKNAAGFDIPKLMVGSLGSLGVLVELTFKVFPKPEAYATLRTTYVSLDEALAALYRLTGSQMELFALDLEPTPAGAALWVRLGGLAAALPERLARLRGLAGGGEVLAEADAFAIWRDTQELAWVPPGWALVKAPVTPRYVARLEADLARAGISSAAVRRRYSAGGQIAWIAMPEPVAVLDEILAPLGLSGLVVLGQPGRTRLGARTGEPFERRVKAALDPDGRFVEV